MTEDELKAIKARHAKADTVPRDYWNLSGLHAHYDREQLLDEVERLRVTDSDSVSKSQHDALQRAARVVCGLPSDAGPAIAISVAVAAIRDALNSLAADGWVLQRGWQPIETAPKNGSSVLVSNGEYVYQAWWNAEPQIWNHEGDLSPCWTLFEPADYYCALHLNEDPPTHWTPLPAAPKTGD